VSRRLWSAAAAAAAVAGVATAVVPQHAASLASLAVATVAVVAALFLLVLTGPFVTARPAVAFGGVTERGAPAPLDPQGLRDARRALSARGDGALPAAVQRRLAAAAERRLAALGVDLDDPERGPAVLGRASWRRLVAPPATGAASDPVSAAATAAAILDDLDRIGPGGTT
jgi:hypothetical protein